MTGRSISGSSRDYSGGKPRVSGRNHSAGMLADIVPSTEQPLRMKLRFNKNKGLDRIYVALIRFIKNPTDSMLEVDLQELRFELAIEGSNPLVFFPKMVNELLVLVSGEKPGIQKILPKINEGKDAYTLDQIREFGKGYFIHDHNIIRIKREGAIWLMRYIARKAQEHNYHWRNQRWAHRPAQK